MLIEFVFCLMICEECEIMVVEYMCKNCLGYLCSECKIEYNWWKIMRYYVIVFIMG